MARKPETRKRIPTDVMTSVDVMITKAAAELRRKSVDQVTTPRVVDSIRSDIIKLFRSYSDVMALQVVARRVPMVLGIDNGKQEAIDGVYEPVLPGMILPLYASVPAEAAVLDEDGTVLVEPKPERWKRPEDCTPDELQAVYNAREADIQGRIMRQAPFAVLRETALRRGCAHDKPVHTVGLGNPDSRPDVQDGQEADLHPK
jgi:hypothetical protein